MMRRQPTYCLHCCREVGRPEGCPDCGADAPGRTPERVPRALPPGTLLDRHYLVGRVLGAGGFGVTYLCADTRLQQPVAVKEYLPREWSARQPDGVTACPATNGDAVDFETGLEKFLREARILARHSEHPNVVPVLNFFEENGTGYMVMRYLEGRTLADLRRASGGRLPERDVVPIALAVLDGLRAVHDKGLVHRDVKPENVFVTNAGQVKLFDFGSARYVSGERSGAMSRSFTPGFAPFEQYHSAGKEGPETDIYALGASLYLLLSGRKPPEAPSRMEGAELEALDRLPDVTVRPHVAAAVTRALELRSKDRFRSALAFQRALLGGDEAGSGQEPSAAAVGRAVRKHDGEPSGEHNGEPSGEQHDEASGEAADPPNSPVRPGITSADAPAEQAPAAPAEARADAASPPEEPVAVGPPREARRPWTDGVAAAFGFMGAWTSSAFVRVSEWAWNPCARQVRLYGECASDDLFAVSWVVGLAFLATASVAAFVALRGAGATRRRVTASGLLLTATAVLVASLWVEDLALLPAPFALATAAVGVRARWRARGVPPSRRAARAWPDVLRVLAWFLAGCASAVLFFLGISYWRSWDPADWYRADVGFRVFYGPAAYALAGVSYAMWAWPIVKGTSWLARRVGRGITLVRVCAAPGAIAMLAVGGIVWPLSDLFGRDFVRIGREAAPTVVLASALVSGVAAAVLVVRRARAASRGQVRPAPSDDPRPDVVSDPAVEGRTPS